MEGSVLSFSVCRFIWVIGDLFLVILIRGLGMVFTFFDGFYDSGIGGLWVRLRIVVFGDGFISYGFVVWLVCFVFF